MTRYRLVPLSLLLVTVLAASPSPAAVFKVATLAPEGSTWMEALQRGARAVAERTAGRVSFRFYPGGTMGNDQAVLRKIRLGQLQGGVVTAGGLAAVYPDVQIYSLPLLFASYEEIDRVRPVVDEYVIGGLATTGFVSFGLVEGGFAYLMSNRPTTSFEELKSRKPWLPEGDAIGNAIFSAAGVSPVPLPLTDVLTGLQTGLIDTIAGTPVGAVALQWFTKVRYLTDVPLIYIYGTMVVERTAFERLSEADRAVVHEEMGAIARELDGRARQDDESARAALRKEGMEFRQLPEDSRGEWRRVADEATRRLAEQGAFTQEMYGRVTKALGGGTGPGSAR